MLAGRSVQKRADILPRTCFLTSLWASMRDGTATSIAGPGSAWNGLFYLMSRGMTEDEAAATIVRGFVEPIARELPMEYALELNRLIELQMEGAVG